MGLVYADISLKNPLHPEYRPVNVTALVDSGAVQLCVPETVVKQLDLAILEQRKVTTADDAIHDVPYAGPVQVCFENRQCMVGALVFGDEVLLGSMPMEDMDVIIHPRMQKLVVNPMHPNFAVSAVKTPFIK
jgi:clan AA aspartic protease